MSKVSLLSGIFGTKCPRCRKGHAFKHPAYSLKFDKMNTCCEHCGHRFEKEPGFFDGAMYVSYAMNVALFIAIFATVHFFVGRSHIEIYITSIIGTSLILAPVTFRHSRMIYMYIFGGVDYEPEMGESDFVKTEGCQ